MIEIAIELIKPDSVESFDIYERGHITVTGTHGSASSIKKQPDQSMMIFISITELLDGVRLFITDSSSKSYNFVGAGSSFQFFLEKQRDLIVLYDVKHKSLSQVTSSEVIVSVWSGVKAFIQSVEEELNFATGSLLAVLANSDLSSAIEDFQKQFHIE
jgi:hypothetical protein